MSPSQQRISVRLTLPQNRRELQTALQEEWQQVPPASLGRLKDSIDSLNGSVRLINGSSPSNGRLEIYYSGVWGTVCGDNWGSTEAGVICAMMGFSRVNATPYSSSWYGTGSGPIWLTDVICNGTEVSISMCSHSHWGDTSGECSHDQDVGVHCSGNFNIAVRLANGSNPSNGRVEIYHDGEWGTVCDDGWGTSEAEVICTMLRYPR
ncbi:CD5 antigen-like [Saccostrea cucullata]|uniref:CD5 antigen-like n=1 Tax=Saccostrea cuccullata TaxID=36930 RepID=UPI002ED167A7